MLLSRSSSSVSNIIEEMIKDRKINITEENSNEPINGEIRDEKDPKINNKDPKIGKDQNLSKIPKIGKNINERVLKDYTKINSRNDNNDNHDEENVQAANKEVSNNNENIDKKPLNEENCHNEEIVNEEVNNQEISININISKEEGREKLNGELSNKEETRGLTGEENGASEEKTVFAEDEISNNTSRATIPSVVGFQVVNENGDEEQNIIWHDPG